MTPDQLQTLEDNLVVRLDHIQRERMKLATVLGIGVVVFVMAAQYVVTKINNKTA